MTSMTVAYALIVLGCIFTAAWLARRWLSKRPPTPEQEEPLPEPTEELGWRALTDDSVTYRCGHEGPSKWVAILFGLELEPRDEVLEKREKCPNCMTGPLFEGVIHCALCGLPVMPGDPVALYAGPKKAFRKEKGWVVKHLDGQAIGCLRWDCCPSGGFFAGHWDGERVRSAFAGGSAAGEALRTGQVVVCGDVSDPDSIGHIDTEPAGDAGGKDLN